MYMRLWWTVALSLQACSSVEHSASDAPTELAGKRDGADATQACTGADLATLDVAATPGSPARITLRYRLLPGTDVTAPTIVYLPGGPGSTSMGESHASLGIPTRYGLLLTDPRGVGCNRVPELPVAAGEFYATARVVDDTQALLAHAGLRAYALYGVSYGTVVATQLAAQLAARGAPQPRAVVLEGTLARTLDSTEVTASYLRLWRDALASRSSTVQAEFAKPTPPLGVTAEAWGTAAQMLLMAGEVNGTYVLHQMLDAADPQTPPAKQALVANQLKNMAQAANAPRPPDARAFYEGIACREIAETLFQGLVLRRGELVAIGDGCTQHTVDRPFASSDVRLSAPIYYLQGTHDPATPFHLAEEHVASQPHVARTLIRVFRGGHTPLKLSLAACADDLWRNLLGSDEDLEFDLLECPAAEVTRWSAT